MIIKVMRTGKASGYYYPGRYRYYERYYQCQCVVLEACQLPYSSEHRRRSVVLVALAA